MKKILFAIILSAFTVTGTVIAQDIKENDVPGSVKSAFVHKYPIAKKVSWEKEKGNFEANWGGKSGEDSSVVYTPTANFVEIVVAIPVNQLPANIVHFVNINYKEAKIAEAGKVTDASGKHMYEVEIKGKDLIFDENGVFIKED
jgi:hypothetical protein